MTEERSPDPTPTEPTPTPASAPPPAYTPPTYAPPPPIAPPQPAVTWAPPAPPAVRAGQRSSLALGAGILLIVLGILGVLFSLAVLTIGREVVRQFDFSGIVGYTGNDPNGFVASVLAFLGILVLVCSTFYIVGGVGIARSKNWGRVIGIVIGILAGLFWLLGVVGGRRADISFELVLVALHAYIAIALLFFWRTRAPA